MWVGGVCFYRSILLHLSIVNILRLIAIIIALPTISVNASKIICQRTITDGNEWSWSFCWDWGGYFPSRFLYHIMVTVSLHVSISIDMYIRVCRTAVPVLMTCQQSITSLCIVFTHGAIKQQVRGAFYGWSPKFSMGTGLKKRKRLLLLSCVWDCLLVGRYS